MLSNGEKHFFLEHTGRLHCMGDSMKRLFTALILLFARDSVSMHRVLQSGKSIIPKNTQFCLNTPRNFGTTHFIVGYKEPQIQPAKTIENKQKIFDVKPPFIIAGSSAHLIDATRDTQSFFTTKHDISSVVLELLAQAKKNINIAAFSLTDVRIANQLIDAHKKGVDVCVIMDAGNMKHYSSKAQKLVDSGIIVLRYDPSLRLDTKQSKFEQLMHLKWIIVDDVLISGSANLTKAAQDGKNIESITVLRCPQTVEEHRQEWQKLKEFCVECK
jgi:phospholipase D